MALLKENKRTIISKHLTREGSEGTPEVQIALLTERINRLTEHFKNYKKDNNSKRGLLVIISNRRKLLNYLEKNHKDRYKSIIEKLKLRK
jgi:small subunit ribosomal protein S15